MKNKQTYIIGEDTPNKKVKSKKSNSKHKKKSTSKPEKQSAPINNAFADAFTKLGITPKDFDKNSK